VAGAVILIRARGQWREWLRTHHAGDASRSPDSAPEPEAGTIGADPSPPDALVIRGDAGPGT
jgi:hypothetical protein